ncbi:MAG: glycosyltransferase family 4 protein [Candidatus Schekmanbacteria bacterium]|nr:glycosyltransferase family 4 protein [Candidatus Schekmanbacteria bacterium]
MKILFITDNFPPETNAPSSRTYEHCREWVKLGADITLITCVPNFPQGKLYKGYSNKLYQTENMDGIKVIRVWSYITANEGFLKRILDYVSFGFTSFMAGLFVKADVIIATSPQFFTTVSAFCLSALKRKPWIFELRDLWPESIKTVGAMKNGTAIRFLERLELYLYKKSDMVIAVAYALKKNLVSRGIDGEKINVVTNGANLELFSQRVKNQEILNAHNLENKFVIAYIGTHGMAHSLEFIVKCTDKIPDEDIRFLFIGDGARKSEVLKIAETKKIKNCIFLNSVQRDAVADYLSVTDVSLVPLIKSDTFRTVIPSKIFESCAMGKPILLGVEGQAKEIIDKYDCGICFEPENETDFIAKVMMMKKDSALYKRLQDNCAILAKDYDRQNLASEMFVYINRLVRKS